MDKLFEKKILSVLADIEKYTRYGAVYYDLEEKNRPIAGKSFCRLCMACVEHQNASRECSQNARTASYQSWMRGDAYLFKCWLGLYGIIIPVVNQEEKITGAVEIGGLFPKGTFQNSLHQILLTLNKMDPKGELPSLVSAFQGTEEVGNVDFASFGAFLRELACSSGLVNASQFDMNAKIWNQQNRISATTENLKPLSMNIERIIFFTALEIAKACDSADRKTAEKKIDEFLSMAILESNGKIEILKGFILIALSVLKIQSCKTGKDNTISDFSLEIEDIISENDAQKLCAKMEKIISNRLTNHPATKKKELILKIINHIEKHFAQDLSVNDVASAVGASPSTVMHRLKEETGMSFTEHLNSMRLKEAKRLLAYTELSIGEIAERCGFADQSYFSKVFTTNLSMNPREFRKMLIKGSRLQH